jgi:hypothetical protein
MAFSFRTRDPQSIFFPTVHVHDSTVHQMADFDHFLYTQNFPGPRSLPRTFWTPGNRVASEYLDVARTAGVVDGRLPFYQMTVVGSFPNADIVVPIGRAS